MKPHLAFTMALSLSPAVTANAAVMEYQPSLGSVPSAQGWDVVGTEIGAVSSGIFSYGPTATSAVHAWNYNHTGAVDFSVDTWSIEANVRLTATYLGNNAGFRRGGFVLLLTDDFGRGIVADLGDAGISLRNDDTGLSDPISAYNLSDAFHLVRLEAGPAGARLFVDGVEEHSLSLGSFSGVSSSILWGEGSTLAYSDRTEIGSVSVVPAPGAVVLAGFGALAMHRRRR